MLKSLFFKGDFAMSQKMTENEILLALIRVLKDGKKTNLIQELDKDEQLNILHKLILDKSTMGLDLMENDDLAFSVSELKPEVIEDISWLQ